MRISDWSSDVCSSDLSSVIEGCCFKRAQESLPPRSPSGAANNSPPPSGRRRHMSASVKCVIMQSWPRRSSDLNCKDKQHGRSEEHTSELQSLMRISYAVFCLKKKKNNKNKYATNKRRIT